MGPKQLGIRIDYKEDIMKRVLFFILFSLIIIVTVPAVAGQLTIPNTFTAGTPAKASEVNANFNAVKVAVDNNSSRLDSIESFQNSPMKMIVNNSGLGTVVNGAWAWSQSLAVTPKTDGILKVIVYDQSYYVNYQESGIFINTTGVAPTNVFTVNFNWNFPYGYNYAFPVLANATYHIWFGVHNISGSNVINSYYEIQAIFHSSSGL